MSLVKSLVENFNKKPDESSAAAPTPSANQRQKTVVSDKIKEMHKVFDSKADVAAATAADAAAVSPSGENSTRKSLGKDYRRVKLGTDEVRHEGPENEIKVTAKGGQRSYITYAIALLNGEDGKTKYDTIKVSGMGVAIYNAVNIAEIVKRRVKGLHQITEIASQVVHDSYEAVADAKKVDVERKVSTIVITLSTKQLDKKHVGYQAPLADDQVTEQEDRPRPPRRERRPADETAAAADGDAKPEGRGRGRGGRGGSRGRGGRGTGRGRGGEGRGRGSGEGRGRGTGEGRGRGAAGEGRGRGSGEGRGRGRGGADRREDRTAATGRGGRGTN